MPIIIGAAVGGAVLLLLIGCVVFMAIKRRDQNNKDSNANDVELNKKNIYAPAPAILSSPSHHNASELAETNAQYDAVPQRSDRYSAFEVNDIENRYTSLHENEADNRYTSFHDD